MKSLQTLLNTPGLTIEPQPWGWLVRDKASQKWVGGAKTLSELSALVNKVNKENKMSKVQKA
jgi:hypothetical protein